MSEYVIEMYADAYRAAADDVQLARKALTERNHDLNAASSAYDAVRYGWNNPDLDILALAAAGAPVSELIQVAASDRLTADQARNAYELARAAQSDAYELHEDRRLHLKVAGQDLLVAVKSAV